MEESIGSKSNNESINLGNYYLVNYCQFLFQIVSFNLDVLGRYASHLTNDELDLLYFIRLFKQPNQSRNNLISMNTMPINQG